MNLPSIIDMGVFGAGAFLGGGIGVALLEGFFHKPKERALTEKERALAEKERALAEAAKADTSIELVRLWMVSNEKLMESNKRLETQNNRLHRDMGETRRALAALANVVERIMPLLEQTIGNDAELVRLSAALQRAQSLND